MNVCDEKKNHLHLQSRKNYYLKLYMYIQNYLEIYKLFFQSYDALIY